MTTIQFYHLLHTPLERALPQLMEKAVKAKLPTVIWAANPAQMQQLNDALWTYHDRSFLPHGSAEDPYPERQPVYITHKFENPNQAKLLVITGGQQPEDVSGFDKVFDIFDGNNPQRVQEARARWKTYKEADHELRYIQQQQGGGWKDMSS